MSLASTTESLLAGVDRGRKGFWNPLLDALNDLGLRAAAQTLATKSNVKFVPEQYLRASASQRLELLRGLLDTDGTRAQVPTRSSSIP